MKHRHATPFGEPAPKRLQPIFRDYAELPDPDALGGQIKPKFARLTHLGVRRFSLAAMRHSVEWIEVFPDLRLDERLAAVRDDPWFQP